MINFSRVSKSTTKRMLILAGIGGIGGIFAETISKGFPVIHAEEKSAKKLSIYDEPKPDILLVESPTRLEEGIRHTRKQVIRAACDFEKKAHRVTDKWIAIEQNTEKTMKEIIAQDERLMPEALYIAVAGLAGTILTRNRNILLRIASPLFFTIASSYYFLPKTSNNISTKIQKYEQNSPELLKVHRSIYEIANDAKQKIDSTISELKSLGDKSK